MSHKFQNKLAEILYLDSLDGTAETTGDVAFEGHFSLIEVTTVIELPDSDFNDHVVTPGTYLVVEDYQGFVSVVEENAREIFIEAEDKYGEWVEND